MSTNAEHYTQDFYAWTQVQAALLEAQRFDALDIVNIVEEITSLAAIPANSLTPSSFDVNGTIGWRFDPPIGLMWVKS